VWFTRPLATAGRSAPPALGSLVVESVYDTFMHRLVEATRSLHVGDAAAASTKVGPVVDASRPEAKIKEYIEKGKQEATLALEMPAPDHGYFVGPTIFTRCGPRCRHRPGGNLWSRAGGD
jgi:RHH-type proline utilization regulon transcriptional repressor/proline dehydrogenase/delta 1-pyrroline-5-carboxylate dehydrogenase